ncbi:MAG: dihydrofolate reductase [Verrucomicrobiales bacterium]|nr:dihydrofolate reductase [Verrucomicrobiales bacterium]MCP5559578.1 dihydrofolate reductase [Verrucomicrobiaceae bacterium]
MPAPKLIAIVAMAANRVIGREGKLPWHFPEDLKFFKRTTLGHPILMGRATFESIGKPLPGRENVVLSNTMSPTDGITVLRDVSELATACPDAKTIYVIGGARLFADLLPKCDGLYLTAVRGDYEGDVFLPPFEHLFDLNHIVETTPDLEFRYYRRKI